MTNNIVQLNGYHDGEKREVMKRSLAAAILFLIVIDLIFLVFMGFYATDASAQMGWGPPPPMGGMMRGDGPPEMMHGHPGMRGEGRPPEQIPDDEHYLWGNLRELALDEKQKHEIKEISNRVMKEMIKKRTDDQIAEIEMKELLDKDPVDLIAVEKKLKQIEAIKTEIQLTLIKAGEEVKSILTPIQRKKLKAMQRRGPMMRERHGGRFDG